MTHSSKDNHVKICYAVEKNNNVSDFQAFKRHKEGLLIGAVNSYKAPSFKIILGSESPYNAKENFTLSCPKKETLDSQSTLGCSGNHLDCGVDSASIIWDKDNILSTTEAEENNAIQPPNRNLIHDLALSENASVSLGKSSKPVTSFEFHASLGNGINIIVDLDASPSDICRRLENEVCKCYHAQNNNRIRSLREELELLGNSSSLEHRFSMQKTDTGKPMDHDHTQDDSIERDFCNGKQFSGSACQPKKESCSSPRQSVLNDVVPILNLAKGDDEPAVSRTGVCAEEWEHVNLGDAETFANFHPKMSLKERPAVIVREKKKRPSLELNLRPRTRSTKLTQRVLPRRSKRLVGPQ